jgi:hypothetical protein
MNSITDTDVDTAELIELARAVYGEHGYNDAAITRLVGRMNTAKHRGNALAFAADVLLSQALRRDRAKILRSNQLPACGGGGAPTVDDVDLLTGKTAGDWPMWRDLKLRMATYEQVEEQYDRLQKHADGTLRHARFLRRVLDRLNPGEIVGDRLSDAELNALMSSEQEGAA